jgi:hypothetical protein
VHERTLELLRSSRTRLMTNHCATRTAAIGSPACCSPFIVCCLVPQLHELSPGYQRYLAMLQGGTNECRMCAHIVQRRLTGDFSRAMTCLWNQTWLKQAGQEFKGFTCPGDA